MVDWDDRAVTWMAGIIGFLLAGLTAAGGYIWRNMRSGIQESKREISKVRGELIEWKLDTISKATLSDTQDQLRSDIRELKTDQATRCDRIEAGVSSLHARIDKLFETR